MERRRLRREREQTTWPSDARLRFILFGKLPHGTVPEMTTLYRCFRAVPAMFRPSWRQIIDRAERGGFHDEVTFERGAWWVHLHPELVRRCGLRGTIEHALRPRL
jgi:hypothetical protein